MQKQQLIEWLTVYICGSQNSNRCLMLHFTIACDRYIECRQARDTTDWVEPSPFSLHRDQQALESFWMEIQVNHLTMQAAAREVAAVPMSSQESKKIKSVVWSLKINILLIFIQHNNSSSSLSSGQESAREVRRAREAEKKAREWEKLIKRWIKNAITLDLRG